MPVNDYRLDHAWNLLLPNREEYYTARITGDKGQNIGICGLIRRIGPVSCLSLTLKILKASTTYDPGFSRLALMKNEKELY